MDILQQLISDLKPQVESFDFKGNTYHITKGGLDMSVRANSLASIMATRKLAGVKGQLQNIAVETIDSNESPEINALRQSGGKYENAYQKAFEDTKIVCSMYVIYAMCLCDAEGNAICKSNEDILKIAETLTQEFINAAGIALEKLNAKVEDKTEDEKNS